VIADNQLALNSARGEEALRLELARLLEAQETDEGLTYEDSIPKLRETPTMIAGNIWVPPPRR
jgi:hypothetical protein